MRDVQSREAVSSRLVAIKSWTVNQLTKNSMGLSLLLHIIVLQGTLGKVANSFIYILESEK